MDAQRATGTVREVFKDMARMVPFPVAWHPRTAMAGHMPGTLQVDGRVFEFSFSFRNTPHQICGGARPQPARGCARVRCAGGGGRGRTMGLPDRRAPGG